jgi:curved DNA-binding protein
VKLKITENSQTGRKLRLKGKGLGDGDQFIELKIVNPRIASDRQRHAFKQLQAEFNS